MHEKFEKLVAAGIQILPAEVRRHFVFERDGFVALVERTESGFGRVGAAGLLAPEGLAYLVWRGPTAVFVGRGFEQEATSDQVHALRQFSADLESSLAD